MNKKVIPIWLLLLLTAVSVFAQKNKTKQKEEKVMEAGAFAQKITLHNTGNINSEAGEFSPVLYLNGLVFVKEPKSGPIDPQTGTPFFELYYADLDPNGLPQKPQPFSVEINSQLHEGPVTFSKKGDRIFFTRNNQKQGLSKADAEERVRLKIYEAQKGYFDWENVAELSFNNDEYDCMHPSLSPDGDKLFFASNRPGGYGGFDLYFVTRQGSGWSQPINLGPEINTNKHESFPFIHDSGILFFASNGHRGQGGLDLYMIDMSSRKWGEVRNLEEPFNSPQDDLGLVLNEEGTIGYFSSNREGGYGKDDVYMFEAPEGIQGIETPELQSTILAVYEANTSRRSGGASIRIFEQSADGLINNDELYDLELMPSGGLASEEMTLKLVRKKEEELGAPQLVTNHNGEAVAQFEANKNYLILISKPGFETKEVTYTSGDEAPERPIEIAIVPSNCMSLEGKVISSRFKLNIPSAIVRIINHCNEQEEVMRTNINGEFKHCISLGCDFTVIAEKEGFNPDSSSLSTIRIRGSRSINTELVLAANNNSVLKEPIRKGTVIILENIYYDFNKSAIRAGAAHELEGIAKLMKVYPSMEIELGAHTDSRGTEAYNLNLSLRRAESAKQFLVRRGVAANRIKAVGYGEAFLRNKCTDDVECTEEEHQYNRRSEVKVIRMDEPVEIKYNEGEVIENN